MSPETVLAELEKQGILLAGQRDQLIGIEQNRPVSLHWELRSVLYVGILLLSSGLGLLIYDNFDQIGHNALLGIIALGCFGCFGFAWRHRPAWTIGQTKSHTWPGHTWPGHSWPGQSGVGQSGSGQPRPGRSTFGDYALLLACLLFLTLEGYAQYTYTVFGERYGLATLLPALLFLPLAYRFDHRGVLGMALTALISWVGVTVRPLELYFKTNFFNQVTVFSAIGLALVLIGVALLLERKRIKPHFTYTYLTIAGNLLMVALLGGLFNFEEIRLWFAGGLALACITLDVYARRNGSFVFLLMSVVYGYIGFTYLFFHYLGPTADDTYYWYFIITGIALVYYLMSRLPKPARPDESL